MRERIDGRHAMVLREAGLGLEEIGEILAARDGRTIRYRDESVRNAIWRHRKSLLAGERSMA